MKCKETHKANLTISAFSLSHNKIKAKEITHRFRPKLTLHARMNPVASQIATLMGPTWGPSGSCRPQVGPMMAPWTLLSGLLLCLTHTLQLFGHHIKTRDREFHPKVNSYKRIIIVDLRRRACLAVSIHRYGWFDTEIPCIALPNVHHCNEHRLWRPTE